MWRGVSECFGMSEYEKERKSRKAIYYIVGPRMFIPHLRRIIFEKPQGQECGEDCTVSTIAEGLHAESTVHYNRRRSFMLTGIYHCTLSTKAGMYTVQYNSRKLTKWKGMYYTVGPFILTGLLYKNRGPIMFNNSRGPFILTGSLYNNRGPVMFDNSRGPFMWTGLLYNNRVQEYMCQIYVCRNIYVLYIRLDEKLLFKYPSV